MRKRKTLLGLGIACACMMIPAVCVCAKENDTTLVYGSSDYTRINLAMDEHGEINILIFDGLTAHDGDNQVVPDLPAAGILIPKQIPIHFTWQKMPHGTTMNRLLQRM